jgi:hypothetical protein
MFEKVFMEIYGFRSWILDFEFRIAPLLDSLEQPFAPDKASPQHVVNAGAGLDGFEMPIEGMRILISGRRQ